MQKRFGRREQIRDRLQVALARRSDGLIGSPLRDLYAERYVMPTEATATTFWGEPMQVVLPELVSCELHRYGVIEPGLTALFLDVVSPGTVVYDVGAHHGYYSMLAAELGARVHTFEPSRAALPLLKANLEDRAVVWSIGVWSSEGTLPLKDFGPTHSALNSFLSAKGEEVGDPKVTYAASVTTIDRHVERTGDCPSPAQDRRRGGRAQSTARCRGDDPLGGATDYGRGRRHKRHESQSGCDRLRHCPTVTCPWRWRRRGHALTKFARGTHTTTFSSSRSVEQPLMTAPAQELRVIEEEFV